MKNPRITNKDLSNIKGAIRRAFARSELHKKVSDRGVVPGHKDPDRPRVTKWATCEKCGKLVPKYTRDVDHIDPVIPIGKTMNDMTLDEVVDRCWCDESNLQNLCEPCHDEKTAVERKARQELKPKKEKKPKVPKKGASKRLAKKLKDLGSQPPPKELVDKLNKKK